MIDIEEMLLLKKYDTPTIYNGWEQITQHDITTCFNQEPVKDFMENMGPMVGRAVTVVFEPSQRKHALVKDAWIKYRNYLASVPGPKIVVVQDLDKPRAIGAFWGEVNSNCHKALGCVGTITDGAIRDYDGMCNAGFHALARCFCVGHAYSTPVSWGTEVEVFGTKVKPGQLIHADRHGFLVIPEEDEEKLLDSVAFMDNEEARTIIAAARSSVGKSTEQIVQDLADADKRFGAARAKHYGRS